MLDSQPYRPLRRLSRHPSTIPATLAAVVLALGLAAAPALRAQESACSDCHEVDAERFAASVHGSLDCTDCHVGANEEPHADTVSAPQCSACHEDVITELAMSIHGKLAEGKGENAWLASCVACHGEPHGILPADDPAAKINPKLLPSTCGQCHANPEMADHFALKQVRPVEAYEASVHARAVADGKHAATCSSCHGSHSIQPAADPSSQVNRAHVPETCGQCHGEIATAYRASIHGQAAAKGVREAPVCTDCHGEHRIQAPEEPGSRVFVTNIPKLTCGSCHGDLRLAEKFGLPAEQVPSFEDSYHGLAGKTGAKTVAHCGSCHGVHDILPSSDPASHTNPANLAATCGQCHPGAGTSFAIGKVHVVPTEPSEKAVFWVRRIYLLLIFFTVGGMVVHNLLDLRRKARLPRLALPVVAPRERLMLGFRIAHALLAASFIILAWSGFALKFPDGWWALPLTAWGNADLRSWVHRVAALVMIGAAVFHVGHLIASRPARRCIAAMRPGRGDWVELKERFAWYLGRRPEPPHTPWVGYPEKLEYLAVIWGTLIMALTGFMLWFENLTLTWLPKWAADVATVIHFYEAILACLSILVWHFYLVIFDPVVYPMDPAWLSGRSAPGREVERQDATIPE